MAAPLRLSRAEARAVDRIALEEFGIPGLVLMENAGLLAALALLPRAIGPVAILCGGGNNGGDGYVVARQLSVRGRDVRVFATHAAERLSGDAAVNRAIAERMRLPIIPIEDERQLAGARAAWRAATLFVDALLGTGFQGSVRPHLARVIEALAAERGERGASVVALDLPSGLDADTGAPSNATVRADRTLTFVAPKRGFDAPGAAHWTGAVEVLPIGAPPAAITRAIERQGRDEAR
jgi:NAD(P)H-hydrate epimerase